MKAEVTAENKPACSPSETNQCHDCGGCERNAHEDQRCVQISIVLLHKVTVVVVGFALELVVEVGTSAASRAMEVRKQRRECFEHSVR